MATDLKVDYLGALPLNLRIRIDADGGRPTVVNQPDPQPPPPYKALARRVAAKIAQRSKDFSSKFPTITVSKAT